MLTFLPMEEIEAMDSWEGAQLNQAKEILAFELTKLVHGEEESAKAREASHALFAGGGDLSNMPTVELTAECYKQRMEKGLSFLEFNYMIMQSYDFYNLFQDYDCNL